MDNDAIRQRLFALRDEPYAAFQAGLIPNIPLEKFIGVRTPALRALAKALWRENGAQSFLETLPHTYFDENQLHAFLLSEERDFAACLAGVERFLPFVDNWATCDQLSPAVFKKRAEELLPAIRRWLGSGETYTVRFGVGILMQHFLDARFSPAYPEKVAAVDTTEYYVHMMVAWYFATALAKQYDAVLPYIEQRQLAPKTHNMAIRKALESYRVPSERKAYLKTLRIKVK